MFKQFNDLILSLNIFRGKNAANVCEKIKCHKPILEINVCGE